MDPVHLGLDLTISYGPVGEKATSQFRVPNPARAGTSAGDGEGLVVLGEPAGRVSIGEGRVLARPVPYY